VAIKDGVLVRGTPTLSDRLDMDKGRCCGAPDRQPDTSQYLSMPPLLFMDMVIYGPAGADWGREDWIGAFQLATGEPSGASTDPDETSPADSWKARRRGARAAACGPRWPWTWTRDRLRAGRNPSPDFYGSVREGDNLYTKLRTCAGCAHRQMLWYPVHLERRATTRI